MAPMLESSSGVFSGSLTSWVEAKTHASGRIAMTLAISFLVSRLKPVSMNADIGKLARSAYGTSPSPNTFSSSMTYWS
ncbi:hypothetical protein D3C73_1467810 [compost metagenome]